MNGILEVEFHGSSAAVEESRVHRAGFAWFNRRSSVGAKN